MPFVKWRKFLVGTGKARAGFVGLVKQSLTAIGNVGTGEDDLISITLEANVLHRNGQGLRIVAAGRSGANGNNKQIKLKFGGTTIFDSGVVTINDKKWFIEAYVYRTATDVQIAFAWGISDATVIAVQRTALTIDDAAAIIIKCTGEATADNDIIQDMLNVEALTV